MGLVHLQDSEGMLDFLPGERLKFITVTIRDNPVPELEKIFRVELYDTDGGGETIGFKLKHLKLSLGLCALESFFLAAYFSP